MADVDFDFFDEAPPAEGKKHGSKVSPRTNQHGGGHKIEAKVPTGRQQYSSGDSDSDSARDRKKNGDARTNVKVSVDSSDSDSNSDGSISHSDKSDSRSKSSKAGSRKNAWGDSETQQANRVRPKSAHPSARPRSSRHQNRPTDSQHGRRKKTRTRSSSHSDSASRSAPHSIQKPVWHFHQASPSNRGYLTWDGTPRLFHAWFDGNF